MLRKCSSGASRNSALQMFPLTPTKNIFPEKLQVSWFLAVLHEYVFQNVEGVEGRKISEVF